MANGNNRKSEAPWFREIGQHDRGLRNADCGLRAAAGAPAASRAGMPKPSPANLAAAGSQNVEALVAKVRAALLKDGVNIPDPHLKGLVTNALAFHKALKGTGALGGGGGGGVRP